MFIVISLYLESHDEANLQLKAGPMMELQHMIELIKSGRTGREQVARAIYDDAHLGNAMKKVLRNYGAPVEEFEDVFHHTIVQFMKLVIKSENFHVKTNLKSYLLGMAKNIWLQKTRGKKIVTTAHADDAQYFDENPTVDLAIIEDEKRTALHAVMDNLGAKCKEVLLLWASGFNMKEIAIQLNYNSDEVARRRKYVCMKSLVKYFEDNAHLKESLM